MKRIVFLGQGVEYVFSDLAEQTKSAGFEVTEIDFLNSRWPELMVDVERANFTLVTSHHPYLGAEDYLKFHRIPAPVISLPEFINTYRPARSYYIPHDLVHPYKDDEIPALKYFDALLMPNERFWYFNRFAPVIPLGWIKLKSGKERGARHYQIALIPSEIPRLLRLQPNEIASLIGPILDRRPIVLLPKFGEIERLANFARSRGAEVAPWGTSTQSIISGAQFVISSGMSSIVAEAVAHGKPVVCLADGVFSPEEQNERLGDLPGVFFGGAEAGLVWIDELASNPARYKEVSPGTDVIPFDTKLFLEIMAGRTDGT
jgi:hypothetical protein